MNTSPTSDRLNQPQVVSAQAYRRMVLLMASMAAACGVALGAIYHDDRAVVRARQTAEGIFPFSYTNAPTSAENVVGSGGALRFAPGVDEETATRMSQDARGKVLELYREDPSTPQVLLNAAMIYGRVGKFTEAAEMLELASKDHPADPLVLEMARTLEEARRTGDTSKLAPAASGEEDDLLDQAVADSGMMPANHPPLDGSDPQAAPMDPAAMRQQLLAALQANPNDITVALQGAAIYLDLEKYAEAKPFLDHALRINPEDDSALQMMAVVAAMEKNPEKSREILQSIITRQPNNGMAMFNLALVNERFLRNFPDALKWYRKCQEPQVELDEETRQQAGEFAEKLEAIFKGKE